MANKNFEIKNGLTVAGTERITSAGLVTGTTTTQAASDNTTKLASTAYVTTALAALADSAPSTLNTLNELAAALGDDANYSTTTTNAIAAKLPLAGGTLTGNLTVPYLATTSYIDLNNSGNRGKIGWSGNHTYVATTSSVGSIIFKNNVGSTASPQTGGDTLLTIADGPKVGIGTTDPSGILSIPATDTTTKPQIRFMTTGATNLADAALSTTDDSGGTSLLIGSNQYYSGGSIARFTTSRSGTAIDFGYTGRIKFFTGAGNAAPTERMQIDSLGHVGINNAPLSGTQVYIKKLDSGTNLMRWGEGTDSNSANSYRFRIDQNYKFVANSGSGDNIVLDSSTGVITTTGDVGIGIAPGYTAGGSRRLLQITNGSNGGQIGMGNNSNESENPRIFSDADNLGFATATTGGGIMQFYTGGQDRLQISAEGYMQMGTAKGNSNYNALFNIVDNAGTSNSLIKLRNGTGNKAIQFYGDNNVEYGYIGIDAQSGAANLLLGSADNRAIRMQSGGMQIELTDGASGTGSVDTGSLSISNTDLDADTEYNIRAGRYLTSNGTGWGSGIDGRNPALVIHNDTSTSNDRSQPGIMLHNENNTDDAYGPFIGWGSKSSSGAYNTGYAWIIGNPTGNGPDANWKAGQLELYTQGSAYVADKPGIRITSSGLVQKPRQYDANGFFWLGGSGNSGGQTGTTGVIFNIREQAGSGNTSVTTGRYTTPVEGIYHFSTNVRIDGADASSNGHYMRLAFYTGTSPSVSQNAHRQGHVIYGPGMISGNYFSMTSSWSVYLQAGVEVGVAVLANVGSYTIHGESNFSGHLVG